LCLDKVIDIGVEINGINVSIDYKDITLIYKIMNSYNQIVKPELDNLMNQDNQKLAQIKERFKNKISSLV
jgi:hypothetical protein